MKVLVFILSLCVAYTAFAKNSQMEKIGDWTYIVHWDENMEPSYFLMAKSHQGSVVVGCRISRGELFPEAYFVTPEVFSNQETKINVTYSVDKKPAISAEFEKLSGKVSGYMLAPREQFKPLLENLKNKRSLTFSAYGRDEPFRQAIIGIKGFDKALDRIKVVCHLTD